jgi:NAD(P)-dependent dehydrogenase (short-subunit alcohol dehydrogenase family)
VSDSPSLEGRRILVVGASAGIGAAFARSAARDGAEVCVSARRGDKLEELVGEIGSGHAIAADVTDDDACEALVASAVECVGGLDLVLYAAGTAKLAPLGQATAEVWRHAYEVNVVGPALVARAAVPHMASEGLISFISSEAAHEFRWGMGTYAASKSALDTAIRYWRNEHPDRRFQRIVMGATMPTDFGNNFDDPELLGVAFEKWMASGIAMTAMETSDVGRHLAELMAVVLAHPEIDVPDLYLDARLA